MSKPTGGPWQVVVGKQPTPFYRGIIALTAQEPYIAIVSDGRTAHSDEWEDNAALIVAAVNACMAVSPSDPLAAAEAYPAIVEALRAMRDAFRGVDAGIDGDRAARLADEALAKIGRK